MEILDDFTVLASDGGYMGSDKFLQFIRDAEMGVKPRGLFEGRGPLAILLIVLVGGLALNLTPCFYPLIPITIGYFSNQSGSSTSRRAALSSM